jgi:hypothetical protein
MFHNQISSSSVRGLRYGKGREKTEYNIRRGDDVNEEDEYIF